LPRERRLLALKVHMPSSFSKRQKEKDRQDRAKEKQARRDERRRERATRPDTPDGEDPDLAGIVAGPQPTPEDQE
jgi:hypothetical protein